MEKEKLHSGSNQPDAGQKGRQQSIFSPANKGQLKRDEFVQLLSVAANRFLRDPNSVLHFVMHVVTPAGLCLVSNDPSIWANSADEVDCA